MILVMRLDARPSARNRFLTAAALLVTLYSASLMAQESRGSITGRITDASGAIMPGVKVTATNTATTVATSAVTNATGNYTIFY